MLVGCVVAAGRVRSDIGFVEVYLRSVWIGKKLSSGPREKYTSVPVGLEKNLAQGPED